MLMVAGPGWSLVPAYAHTEITYALCVKGSWPAMKLKAMGYCMAAPRAHLPWRRARSPGRPPRQNRLSLRRQQVC